MRTLRAAAGGLVALAPRVALACPACARDGNSSAVAWLIGGMVLAPLVFGGIIFAVARRIPRDGPQP